MRTTLVIICLLQLYIMIGMGFALLIHINEPPDNIPIDDVRQQTVCVVLGWPKYYMYYRENGAWDAFK